MQSNLFAIGGKVKPMELLDFISDSWLVKGILSVVSMVLVHLFGAWDIMLQSMVTLLALDLIAKIVKLSFKHGGFLKAIRAGKIKSQVMRDKTMYKLVRYAITLAAGNQIANVVKTAMGDNCITIAGIPANVAIRSFFILWLCVTEFISILETLVQVDGDDLQELLDTGKIAKKNFVEKLFDKFTDALTEKLTANIECKPKQDSCPIEKESDK